MSQAEAAAQGNTEGAAVVEGQNVDPGNQEGQQTTTQPEGGESLLSGGTEQSGQQEEKAGQQEQQPDMTPEAYGDFTVSEGFSVNNEVLAEFKQQAAKLNISKEDAQGLINLQMKTVQAEQAKWVQVTQGWADETRNDAEIGGENLGRTVELSKAALSHYDPDNVLFGILEQSGYGNHPKVLRALSRMGADLEKEHKITIGKGGGMGGEKPLTERLWPDKQP
jgi:hypothetical protein